MKFLSRLRHGHNERHRRPAITGPPSVIGSDDDFPHDEKACDKGELPRGSFLSPTTTIGSDSMFTSTNSLTETGSTIMCGSSELQSPPSESPQHHRQHTLNSFCRQPRIVARFDTAELAESHFHRGCELWAQQDFFHAMEELRTSKIIWERCHPHLVLLMQHPLHCYPTTSTQTRTMSRRKQSMDTASSKDDNNEVEAVAQLFYAIGTVHLAMADPRAALIEFRRSLQVAILGLKRGHPLVDATMYMMRMSLLTLGYASHKIRSHIRLFVEEVQRERQIDGRMKKHSKAEECLNTYASLDLLHDKEVQTRVRILTKIGALHEEQGEFMVAAEVWSDVLGLYQDRLQIAVEHPLLKEAKQRSVAILMELERLEI